MTKTTVAGVATKVGGIARAYNAAGGLADAHTIRKIELELPEQGLDVNLDHDPGNTVGEVVYVEIDRDQRLNVVAVIDGDWIRSVDRPVYFSSEFDCRGKSTSLYAGTCWSADRAYLTGMSLTLAPASMDAKPVRLLPGDVRAEIDRYSMWPSSWRPNALLERTVERSRRETRARWIENYVLSEEQIESMYYARAAAEAGVSRGRNGPIEYSMHVGRVLSVR